MKTATFSSQPVREFRHRRGGFTLHPVLGQALGPVSGVKGFGRAISNGKSAPSHIYADSIFTFTERMSPFRQQILSDLQRRRRNGDGRSHAVSVLSSIQR